MPVGNHQHRSHLQTQELPDAPQGGGLHVHRHSPLFPPELFLVEGLAVDRVGRDDGQHLRFGDILQLLEQLLIRTGKIDLFVIVQRGALLDKGLVRHQDVPDRYLLGESAAHPDGDHPLDPEDSERLDGVYCLRRAAAAI